MRSEALPSQSAGQGSVPPDSRRSIASSRSARRRASVVSRFVPSLIVIGRSVFGPQRQAGHAQEGRLLLQAARVGQHARGAASARPMLSR